ncbi:MAG: Dabb family protein [Candidatus Hydrogenedentes bacterium]|nr:Dabb family protein [Candidatus Hydrogenedentota bacterium]
MRVALALTSILLVFAAGCISVKGNVDVKDESRDVTAVSHAEPGSVFRHVVLFKFKAGTSDADIEKVRTAFHNLKNGIPTVRNIESGRDVSTEGLQQGFTHCFIVTFENAAGRDTYLKHPIHDEFVKLAGPHLEQALVVDFIP